MVEGQFDKAKTYEPSLVRAGMMEVEDNSTKIKMSEMQGFNGSLMMTKDYLELLSAYKVLERRLGNANDKNEELDKNKKPK